MASAFSNGRDDVMTSECAASASGGYVANSACCSVAVDVAVDVDADADADADVDVDVVVVVIWCNRRKDAGCFVSWASRLVRVERVRWGRERTSVYVYIMTFCVLYCSCAR